MSVVKSYFKLERDIPSNPCYDVVVAGGGPSGTMAAISAARLGAKVLLLESTGALGGMATNGFISYWYCMGNNVHSMVGGLVVEICEILYERGAIEPGYGPDNWLRSKRGFGFDTEILKIVLDEMCRNSGVEVRFETRVIDVDIERSVKRINGVIVHNIEGYNYIPAKAVIDATGDAFLINACGESCREAGRDTENIMPPTLCARIANIDYNQFDRENMRQFQQERVDRAVADGFLSVPDRHIPGIFRTGESEAIMNCGHLFNMDALSVQSLSNGYVKGRRFAQEYISFYRKYVEGCEKAIIMATASLMGVRESRRIIGEYELDWEDFKIRRKFPDQIAIYCKQVDVHVYAPTNEEYERVFKDFDETGKPEDGEYYGIPYGILVPKGWKNLWAAGRCVSTDVKVNGSLRDQPACMMMGQAVGTAAVQHCNTGEPANMLNTKTLVETLRANNCNLPQVELSETMTKS